MDKVKSKYYACKVLQKKSKILQFLYEYKINDQLRPSLENIFDLVNVYLLLKFLHANLRTGTQCCQISKCQGANVLVQYHLKVPSSLRLNLEHFFCGFWRSFINFGACSFYYKKCSMLPHRCNDEQHKKLTKFKFYFLGLRAG